MKLASGIGYGYSYEQGHCSGLGLSFGFSVFVVSIIIKYFLHAATGDVKYVLYLRSSELF